MFLLENAGEAVTSTTVSAVADVFPKSGIENLAADASFGEKLAYALKYAAIGLMTVFMVLIIIMAVLYLFKLFSVFGSKKKATATTAPAPSLRASSPLPVTVRKSLLRLQLPQLLLTAASRTAHSKLFQSTRFSKKG